MDAYTFISKCIKPYISVDNFNISSGCNLCGRKSVKIDKNNEISNICCICSFMQTPNSDYFGMLTSVRAHSPVSFLNSLIIFDEKSGLTLVVSDKYAKQVPQTTPFKFVVYGLNDIIINMLNNPCKRVIIKPSIRYEEYAEYLMLSDERSLYLTTPKGGIVLTLILGTSCTRSFFQTKRRSYLRRLSIFKRLRQGVYSILIQRYGNL